MHKRARTTLLALSTVLALSTAACGGSDPSPAGAAPAATAGSGQVSAEHNDADIMFIQAMTPHHVGAIAMAELAPSRASNDEVKALAGRIVAAQDPELARMQEMASAWGVTLDDSMAGMDMDMEMDMAMGDASAALSLLEGAEFDSAFLTAMTAHHEGALDMARSVQDEGENPEAAELAEAIVASQTAEIAEMKDLLTQL